LFFLYQYRNDDPSDYGVIIYELVFGFTVAGQYHEVVVCGDSFLPVPYPTEIYGEIRGEIVAF
jgi:hypothetical protein